jgi:hypothetical protein
MISLLLAVNTIAVQPIAAPVPPTVAIEQPAESTTGLVFKNIAQSEPGPLNVGKIVQEQVTHVKRLRETGVEYVDKCGRGERVIGSPYKVLGFGTETIYDGPVTPYLVGDARMRGWFISEKTPPAPGLRVVIKNTTNAIEPAPYTDREYDMGARSESFIAAMDTEHQNRFLALQNGVNRFTYAIKRGHQVIESGQFAAQISEEIRSTSITETVPRRKEYLQCIDAQENLSGKHDRRFESEYRRKRIEEENRRH